jgi:hypothetical protein
MRKIVAANDILVAGSLEPGDAALIVRAVNERDELIAALRGLLDECRRRAREGRSAMSPALEKDPRTRNEAALDIARQALRQIAHMRIDPALYRANAHAALMRIAVLLDDPDR